MKNSNATNEPKKGFPRTRAFIGRCAKEDRHAFIEGIVESMRATAEKYTTEKSDADVAAFASALASDVQDSLTLASRIYPPKEIDF